MDSFLKQVAHDLTGRFGADMKDLVVLFPSRRARLFFNTCLWQEVKAPLWAPRYLSLEELFAEHSPYLPADTILLIGELYKIYVAVYNEYAEEPTTESLDEFYFFGETLLNDFDEIDKSGVLAKSLFRNLRELDELKDDFTHLSPAQEEALKRFASLFTSPTPLKDSFLSVWNILGEVYERFREYLSEEGIAYPGMAMREVIEKGLDRFSEDKHYAFVGFNVLNHCEEKLFSHLKDRSLFYWDYDDYYLKQEAGRFIRKNIARFGSALQDQKTNLLTTHPKRVTLLASPTESGQCGVIPGWIDSLKGEAQRPLDFSQPDSAIILCNESLLPLVMHSIPSERVENVNITMGFPISQTPVATFLYILAELQSRSAVGSKGRFYYESVLPVLRNPYVRLIFPEASEVEQEIVANNLFYPDREVLRNSSLFRSTATAADLSEYLLDSLEQVGREYRTRDADDLYDGLYQESIFRAYQLVKRLHGLLVAGELALEKPTFLRLLQKLLSSTQVPFHGEPLKGLQVMGLLETRTIDFRNLLLLNVNEGFMPASTNENTFIPQFLRNHFGLDTIEHQESIFSYYFYRSIQRAENITLVYNTDKSGIAKAEISRFLLQLLVDRPFPVNRFALQMSVKPYKGQPIVVEKSEEVLNELKTLFDFRSNSQAKPLTPSSLNLFIDCPLRFYLQKVKGYQSDEEFSEEVDSSHFGTIFHHAAEYLYREIGRVGNRSDFAPFVVRKEDLEYYLDPKSDYHIRRFVARAFQEDYFRGRPVDESEYNGEQLINFRVLCEMVRRLIRFDLKQTPFSIIGLESKEYLFFDIEPSGLRLKVGGVVDRLEERGGRIIILDYKTGGKRQTVKSIEELFEPKEKRAGYIFQTFVYASVMARRQVLAHPLVPALLYLQEAGKANYSSEIEIDGVPISDFSPLQESFENRLQILLNGIFDPGIHFTQTPVTSNCRYCDFREMCNR